jgi:hypothetical protein
LLKFVWLKDEGIKKKSRQPSARYVVLLTKAAPTDHGGGKRRDVIVRRTYTAKPPAIEKTGGFAFTPYDVFGSKHCLGVSN